MKSPEEWRARAADKERAAKAVADDKRHCREAIVLAGSAVEFALKGLIMKRERFNSWPDRGQRPDLHVHSLEALFDLAHLQHSGLSSALRANLRVAFSWSRWIDYEGGRVPRRLARDMMEASFGEDGVVPWLNSL
jgi:HEPN domain-containing protein